MINEIIIAQCVQCATKLQSKFQSHWEKALKHMRLDKGIFKYQDIIVYVA